MIIIIISRCLHTYIYIHIHYLLFYMRFPGFDSSWSFFFNKEMYKECHGCHSPFTHSHGMTRTRWGSVGGTKGFRAGAPRFSPKKETPVMFPKLVPIFIELDDGKIYRKALYLMVKTMVSCRFSLKPIQWYIICSICFKVGPPNDS